MRISILFLISLMCVALSACTVDEPPPKVEDTSIGSQLAPMNKARNFEDEYEKALQRKRESMDRNIDG